MSDHNFFMEFIQPRRWHDYFLNTMMLLVHLAFALLYRRLETTWLFNYNLISIATFLFEYYVILKGWERLYYLITYGEIFVFMTLNLLLLGWNYGFELYCYSYAITIQLVGFILARNKRQQMLFSVLDSMLIIYFLGMWLILQNYQPIYAERAEGTRQTLYMCNAVMTLSMCVNYVGMFTRIVYGLARNLHYNSTHDALTDLNNRRHMWEVMRAGKRGDCCGGVAMLDVDDFKKINDTYGHAAGDAVLRALAWLLKALEQNGFTCSRWGGEEFLICCGAVNPDDARAAMEDLVRKSAEQSVDTEAGPIQFTVTVGLVTARGPADIQRLISAADDLLYQGKQSGKNRLVSKEYVQTA